MSQKPGYYWAGVFGGIRTNVLGIAERVIVQDCFETHNECFEWIEMVHALAPDFDVGPLSCQPLPRRIDGGTQRYRSLARGRSAADTLLPALLILRI